MEDSNNPALLEEFYLNCGFATRALHAGEHVGQPSHVAHTGAIYQTSTFVFKTAEEGAAIFAGEQPGYMYTRLGNPTVMALEAKMNALEGREAKLRDPLSSVSSIAFSSGMGAIAGVLVAICKAGDTIIMGDVVYGATEHFASNIFARYGVKTVEVDTSNLEAVKAAILANPTAVGIILETPTNPMLSITDIQAVSDIVRDVNPDIHVIVDNTFATPYLQRPLNLGADVVVHSTTKYISGHGQVVGGIMVTTDDFVKRRAYEAVKDLGSNPGPMDAFLTNLGLKTLPLRMDRHCDNAEKVAEFLVGHPKVDHVYFPGLPSHPHHEVAKKQMKRFGGMVSFDLEGGVEAGRTLMNNIKIFTLAVSLGCVDSLIQHPASMTHACVPKWKREKSGVTDGLVRVSVGLEDIDDLLRALDEGLAAV